VAVAGVGDATASEDRSEEAEEEECDALHVLVVDGRLDSLGGASLWEVSCSLHSYSKEGSRSSFLLFLLFASVQQKWIQLDGVVSNNENMKLFFGMSQMRPNQQSFFHPGSLNPTIL
jgi:hypothetical protein